LRGLVNRKRVPLLFFLVLILSANASNPVWPPPPETARVAYKNTITKAKDLKIEKGFFAKVWSFLSGSKDQKLIKPFGLHVDDQNRIYISDIALKALFIFDKKHGKQYYITGTKKYPFLSPMDIDTDHKGNIYVSDSIRRFIYVFDKNGKYKHKIGTAKTLKRPVGIAINNKNNRIYIVDTLANNIKIYSLSGKYIGTIGKVGKNNGRFNKPTYLALDNNGNIYVSDTMNHRIQVFDKNGKYLSKFGKIGNKIGTLANPRGIDIDKNGYIYVSDTTFHTIQIFDRSGRLMLIFGGYGEDLGTFAIPEDLAIFNNTLYVSDSYNMRLQVFKLLNRDTQKGKK